MPSKISIYSEEGQGLDESSTIEITDEQVIDAIAQERRVELFLEWGHRWFDLKKDSGKAGDVLSAIPYKQPWWGEYQDCCADPIPANEINETNIHLIQNPLYNVGNNSGS